MKVACLVLGCFAPRIFARTLPVFKAANWTVFVHVDAKIGAKAYASELGVEGHQCIFVDSVDVFWGGYSMLQAERRLINAALAHDDYDKLLLISDDTLPVHPPSHLNQILQEDRDFITAMAQNPGSPNYERYQKFFFYDHPATMMRAHGSRSTEIDDAFLTAMQEIAALRLIGKKRLTIAYGSQFWALRRETMKSVLRIWDEDIHLAKSFAYSPLPDETLIQSILRTFKYDHDIDFQPLYADFHSQQGGPRILETIAGLPYDLQPHQLFVRKINPNAAYLAEAVTRRLLSGMDAWGLTSPDSYCRASHLVNEDGQVVPVATVRLCAPSNGQDAAEFHGVEEYSNRQYRWTASERVSWRLPLGTLPAGCLRIFFPVLLAKPDMLTNSRLLLGTQEKPLRYTRHSLIAEFEHSGLASGTSVTLITPKLVPAAPPRDNRLLGLGLGVEP